MLRQNSYDTVCHEHLEYYSLRQIDWMARRAGLTLVDVSLNDINGGSFAITATPSKTARPSPAVERLLHEERELGFDTAAPYPAKDASTAARQASN